MQLVPAMGIESLIGVVVGLAVGLIVGRRWSTPAAVRPAPRPPPIRPSTVDEIDQLIGEIRCPPTPTRSARRSSSFDTQPLWAVQRDPRRLARGSVAPPRMLDDLIAAPSRPHQEASVIVDDELLVRWAYTTDAGRR